MQPNGMFGSLNYDPNARDQGLGTPEGEVLGTFNTAHERALAAEHVFDVRDGKARGEMFLLRLLIPDEAKSKISRAFICPHVVC